MREAMVVHDQFGESSVTHHGGALVRPRGEGDSRFAVFRRASDAVAAAAHVVDQIEKTDWDTPDPIRIRVGVHTGEADLRDGDYYGTAVNLCARIRALAEPNQVVLSEATSHLLMRSDTQVQLHEIGAYELKGLALPERVFALGEGTGPSDTDTRTSSTTGRRANPHERGAVATTENITVLFTDLVGSTELASSLTPEAGDEVRRNHFSALRQAIATSGGTEVKNLGDGLMVVFPAASAALACAVAMQQAVQRDNAGAERPLGVRVGLSAGEATTEDGDYFGDPVIEAARLCAKCRWRADPRRRHRPGPLAGAARTPSPRSENWN